MKSIFNLIFCIILFNGCSKGKQPTSNIELPKGEFGLYLGMSASDLTVLNMGFNTKSTSNSSLNYSFVSTNIKGTTSVVCWFSKKTNRLIELDIYYPAKQSDIESVNNLVKNYKNMYGQFLFGKDDDSYANVYRWTDGKVEILLEHKTYRGKFTPSLCKRYRYYTR